MALGGSLSLSGAYWVSVVGAHGKPFRLSLGSLMGVPSGFGVIDRPSPLSEVGRPVR